MVPEQRCATKIRTLNMNASYLLLHLQKLLGRTRWMRSHILNEECYSTTDCGLVACHLVLKPIIQVTSVPTHPVGKVDREPENTIFQFVQK
jgi:hypothetical protein